MSCPLEVILQIMFIFINHTISATVDYGELPLVRFLLPCFKCSKMISYVSIARIRYLKQIVTAPHTPSSGPGHFTTVQWHPEDALCLTLSTQSECQLHSLSAGSYSVLTQIVALY